MQLDLLGRIANFPIKSSAPLLPLFEAIVNSIHSIWERKDVDSSNWEPYISISVIRDDLQVAMVDKFIAPITGFIIEDNGIGFTRSNYEAFTTSDTTSKLKLGGKGVGRFTWLKAFGNVKIISKYQEDRKFYERCFEFSLQHNGTGNERQITIEENEWKTLIQLLEYKQDFQLNCPRRLDKIASKIIEHCLSFFILGDCPKMTISDGKDVIDLYRTYRTEIDANSNEVSFSVGKESFSVKHVKIYSRESLAHRIHLCAHKREVVANRIHRICDLTKQLVESDQREFSYSAYVSGQYLDETVNESRTGFFGYHRNDNDNEELLLPGEISWKQISDGIYAEIEKFLAPYLEPIRQSKMNTITSYVHTKAPQYRHIIKRHENLVSGISPDDMDEAKLDIALYKIKQHVELRTKTTVSEIVTQDLTLLKDTAEYEQKVSDIITIVNEEGKAALSQYIVHRRVILNLLEKWLELQPTGKYSREDRIHELIVPMQTTSDEIGFKDHNLWLIDERLAYHYYLASDKEIGTNKPIDSSSDNRADLIVYNNIYDNAIAFANDKPPFGSITIVEFKRPERTSYSDDDTDDNNPIQQVLKYVRDILDSKCFTKQGRRIDVPTGTPFYCYILCDISPKLRSIAVLRDFKKTPDDMGMFFYLTNLNTYIEIISYDKLLKDAKQRNQVLFDQLGI